MPLDPTGKEILRGSIVSYPRGALEAQYGIVTSISPSRVTINNSVSKPHNAVFVLQVSQDEVRRLTTQYAEALGKPQKTFTPKYCFVKFNSYNRNVTQVYYAIICSEDGSSSTAELKAANILSRINETREPANKLNSCNYMVVNPNKDLRTGYSFSYANFNRRLLAELDLAYAVDTILTREDILGMGFNLR